MSHVLTCEDDNKSEFLSLKEENSYAYKRANFYVPYPVQNSIPYFGLKLQQQCMRELNEAMDLCDSLTTTNKKNSINFAEFSKRIFGETLQKAFIRPYNEKVWTVPLEEMNSSWVEIVFFYYFNTKNLSKLKNKILNFLRLS